MVDLNNIMDVAKNPEVLVDLAKSPNIEAVAIAGLSVIAVGVVLIYVMKSVTPITPFLYANARIQAGSHRSLSSKKIRELADIKSLDELHNVLRESDYGEDLEKMPKDLRSFHMAIEKGFLRSLEELKDMSPKKFSPIIDAYFMFLEATVLKTVFRAKFYQNKLDESLVFSVGNLNPIILKHLIEADTIADMGVVMSATKYQDVFKKYNTIEEFDIAIDGFVLKGFVDTVKKTKLHEGSHIIDIINKKIDILNLLALIKFRIRNVEKENQIKYLINNESGLAGRFKDIIFAETFQNFIEAIKGLPYYGALAKALSLYEKDGSLFHFENELYRYYNSYVLDLEMAHSLGPYPLAAYLIKKEIEKRNLFILSKGIGSNFPAEKIKEMVV